MKDFGQGLQVPIISSGKPFDSVRSRKIGLASLGVHQDSRFQDTLRRESFDIWRDTTSTTGSIEDSSSTTSYLNNIRKSSIPKGYTIVSDNNEPASRKTSVSSRTSTMGKLEETRRPFTDLLQGSRGWSNDGKYFVKREEEKDKDCPVHGHGHHHSHSNRKKRETTPTMSRKTSAPSKVTTQKVEMKFGLSPFRKTSLPITKSEAYLPTSSFSNTQSRRSTMETLKSKPPSGDLRSRRSTSSEPLTAPLLIRKTSVSSVELDRDKTSQLEKLEQRYSGNSTVGKMSTISSDLFKRSDELRRSLSLKPYNTNINNTKGQPLQLSTLPRDYSSGPGSQKNSSGSLKNGSGSNWNSNSNTLGGRSGGSSNSWFRPSDEDLVSYSLDGDGEVNYGYETNGNDRNTMSRQRSFPDLRKFSDALDRKKSNTGDSPSKTIVKIEDKRKSVPSTLQRGPGRFSLKHKSGGSTSTPSLGSLTATAGNSGSGSVNGSGGSSNKHFLTPTFSSLTRSLSGLNLTESGGAAGGNNKKYTSTTDILYSGAGHSSSSSGNQNITRKISEPNLRRPFDQSGMRKLSDSTLPGVRKTYDSLPSRKTSLPVLSRKLSSESSLTGRPTQDTASTSRGSTWTLPGKKMLSSSSLSGWKSSSSVNSGQSSSGTSQRTTGGSFSPSSILSQMTRKLSSSSNLSQRGSPTSPPRLSSPAPESLADERGSEHSGGSARPSREWPYCSILKTPGKRRSGMKHVEFLDNLSESDYVAREY